MGIQNLAGVVPNYAFVQPPKVCPSDAENRKPGSSSGESRPGSGRFNCIRVHMAVCARAAEQGACEFALR